ncbi:helix-turn-helix transcriptional regulator [Endozoicomonas sp. 4G]|uniref:helix-turn-helix domain-containing protein n=1 Tax=Endozoicomonas sp. 4G TaxID=2872754 RepID=UPI0020787FFA|nr:helix-turn-helix transcriptional regulator [Endozoicomonas sp. 4G]
MKTQEELAKALRDYRKSKGLGQKDMLMRIGMSQQQYQRAESGSDLRVSTLFRILEGLDLELKLIPRHLSGEDELITPNDENRQSAWQGFLKDLED